MGEFDELDIHEALDRKIERHAYDRLIVLADGVFAIAATLLALEVKIPPGWTGHLVDLFTVDIITAVISYAVSFLVVAIYWMGNRRILSMFRKVDGVASVLTVLVLMLVALLPPVSRTLMIGGKFTDAALFYVGYVTLIGWVQALLWGYGAFVAKLTEPAVDRRTKWVILIWMLVVPTTASALTIYASRIGSGFGYLGTLAVTAAMIYARHTLLRRPARKDGASSRIVT